MSKASITKNPAAKDTAAKAGQAEQEPAAKDPTGAHDLLQWTAARRPDSPASTRLNSSQVLGMQTKLGNRAVQRVLTGQRVLTNQQVLTNNQHQMSGSAPRQTHALIQRWEGQEHAALGDTTGQTIDLGGGVVLTWGQVIAIAGDEIGSLAELEEAAKTETGKGKIRAALENAGVPGAAATTLPAPTPDQKKEQESNYYTLLLDNVTHFQSGGKALDEWRKHHTEAVNRALRAGIMNPAASTTEINKAYLAEAFGQHFLTDMFSAGHIRTPRSEIADFYVNTFAPKVITNLLNNLKKRLEDGIYAQIAAQSWKARNFEGKARTKIRNGINGKIDEQMAKLKGGQAQLTEMFGKALAGVISGAIHDAEGARGTMVSSVAHPTPWLALGDSRLEDPANFVNKQEAQKAVQAGLADVNHAYTIGQNEGTVKEALPTPTSLPEKVFFKFNSDLVLGAADEPVKKAAAYLAYNPDTHLELVGHTDPIGKEDYNDDLGTRRANSIKSIIMAHNVPDSQVSTSTRGKTQLASANPKKYNLNRRVEFFWTSRPPAAPSITGGLTNGDQNQIAFERARQNLAADIGPPYFNVENYLPKEATGLNPPLPDWRWDSMSPSLEKDINAWVAARFSPDLQKKVIADDMLNKTTIEGYDIEPRPIVQGLIGEINANPMGFLRQLFK